MASLGNVFNRDDLPQSEGFDPIPDGWYQAVIEGAELKPTKDGTGKLIAVKYKIMGPTHANRTLFGNLNIKNRSADAERIGLQQLGSIMGAIGIAKVQDTDQLIGGRLEIKVAYKAPVMENGHEKYPAGNEVKGFKAIEGSVPPSIGSSIPKPTQTATAGSSAPWAKKPEQQDIY